MSAGQPCGRGMSAKVFHLPRTPGGREILQEALRAPGGVTGVYGLGPRDLDWDKVAAYGPEVERDLARASAMDLEIARGES